MLLEFPEFFHPSSPEHCFTLCSPAHDYSLATRNSLNLPSLYIKIISVWFPQTAQIALRAVPPLSSGRPIMLEFTTREKLFRPLQGELRCYFTQLVDITLLFTSKSEKLGKLQKYVIAA